MAIIIVGFRNPDDICKCLASLAKSTHSAFEVVICENGGPEAHRALAARLPRQFAGGQPVTLLLAPGNLGYAGGVNFAMRHASSADAWWVLNPDTKPQPTALAAMLARLAEGDCDAVGATLYLPDGSVQSYGGRWQMLLARAVALGRGAGVDDPVDPRDIERRQSYVSGACMLVSRRFLDTVGPMREDYFLYCEEVEWCLRAQKVGARLGFAPAAQVLHIAGTTTGSHESFHKMPKTPVYLNERNRLLLTRDLFPQQTPLVALGALAVIVMRFGRRGAWRQMGYALQGWFAGLAGLRGKPAWIPSNPTAG